MFAFSQYQIYTFDIKYIYQIDAFLWVYPPIP